MANCRDGDIRLTGGVTDYEGRVQICINKAWGGVCIPGWGGFDSRVVCRQLGHMERGKCCILFVCMCIYVCVCVCVCMCICMCVYMYVCR